MLQGSGTIRFSNIISEFGRADGGGGVSLGRYRVSQTFGSMSNLPLDTGIPQSGSISISNFYSKQLNCVVNYYDGSNLRRATARNRYNNGGSNRVQTIGGFRGRPSNTNGTRVIIHVNKRIGSEYDGSRGLKCALRTGSWNNNTNLDLNIGSAGAVIGAAGAGGKGGNRSGGPTAGQRGSSGLGVEYPLDITNYGFIAGGGGGGGGGAGKRKDRHDRSRDYRRCGWWCDSRGRNRRKDRRRKGGGGGGGGQGFPGGAGGSGGDGGSNGSNGSQGSPGSGGGGGGDGARSGGNGGSYGSDGSSGDTGGGSKGRSIVISGSGSVNYVVSGTIYGPTFNGGVF